jgi:hypothetical protein
LRYPRVGGAWTRSEGSINQKPGKSLKMPQTPTRRVHAVLGVFLLRKTPLTLFLRNPVNYGNEDIANFLFSLHLKTSGG